jgi:hypothetical protein
MLARHRIDPLARLDILLLWDANDKNIGIQQMRGRRWSQHTTTIPQDRRCGSVTLDVISPHCFIVIGYIQISAESRARSGTIGTVARASSLDTLDHAKERTTVKLKLEPTRDPFSSDRSHAT